MSKTQEPRYIYRPMNEGATDYFRVGVARDENDEYGDALCTVHLYKFSKEYWKITETNPSDFLDLVQYIQFATKEMAAQFFHALHIRSQRLATDRPLTDEMARYLEDRARHLHDEEQALNSRMMQVHSEQYALNQLAVLHKVPKATYLTELSDMDKAVEELVSFEVEVNVSEEEDDGEPKYEMVPFISETALYNLFGKDAARSILVRLGRICKHVAPITAAKYF